MNKQDTTTNERAEITTMAQDLRICATDVIPCSDCSRLDREGTSQVRCQRLLPDAAAALERIIDKNEELKRQLDAAVEELQAASAGKENNCKYCAFISDDLTGCTHPDGRCTEEHSNWAWHGPVAEAESEQ